MAEVAREDVAPEAVPEDVGRVAADRVAGDLVPRGDGPAEPLEDSTTPPVMNGKPTGLLLRIVFPRTATPVAPSRAMPIPEKSPHAPELLLKLLEKT